MSRKKKELMIQTSKQQSKYRKGTSNHKGNQRIKAEPSQVIKKNDKKMIEVSNTPMHGIPIKKGTKD